MQQNAEVGLVLAAQRGDLQAFEVLYRDYFDRVYDFAVRSMRDRHRAADAVQDAFLKAHERINQLRNPGAFRAWLYAIVRREIVAQSRRAKRDVPTAPIAGEDAELNPLLTAVDEDALSDPTTSAELADSAALVWAAAESLDADTYSVLDLHVRQGLTSAEIASYSASPRAMPTPA
jgi:RNA polymerase sigma-70 factor (ECF subfamily)